ncbi:MAG: hypothetical protein K0S33_1006 [Bacteroidetes bacterium]|jgi:hypothetical protein|nr:hypothetical protein [Bacteroidota bacterium]
MCFSAAASFGAGVTLSGIGVIALKNVRETKQVMFAAIPVLFGIQQICEGFLWLSFADVAFLSWRTAMTFAFLFFAQCLWPAWIPASLFRMERDPSRRKILLFTSLAGSIATCVLTYRLLFYNVTAVVQEHHIYYRIQSPQNAIAISSIFYLIAIILPPFISGAKGMQTIGFLLSGSLILTKLFYENYFISVWCFFAALISILIVYVIRQDNKAIGSFN